MQRTGLVPYTDADRYLDTWHGIATLMLLPCFIVGLILSYRSLPKPMSISSLFKPSVNVRWMSPFGIGRALLLATAIGMIVGGLTIMVVGMKTMYLGDEESRRLRAETNN